jgi:hypothetical protein
MKPNIVITLGVAVFTIVLAAYLFAYATTVRDPVEWKNGDVIVQDARVAEILPVFAATGGYTHVGVVEVRDGEAVVIEAADKVRETPTREFLKRGEGGAFAVYRLNSLTPEQGAAVAAAARRQIGKPNDFFLRRNWEQLYSSELVRLAFSDVGIEVGRSQRLGKIPADLTAVRSQLMRAWTNNEDCQKRKFDFEQCWVMISKQEVVTPASIVEDKRMTKVFEVAKPEKQPFALSRASDKADEAPAP